MSQPAAPHLACIVGEHSGDLLIARALQQLRTNLPALQLSGVAGPQLKQLGMTGRHTIDALAVRGVFEVIRHYPRLKRLQNELIASYRQQPPDLFLGVDAPDFNLKIATQLKQHGIKTAHFISPSIWAWRAQRIEKIRHAVDTMLLIFPFEEAIYRRAKIDAVYVGHPLAEQIPLRVDTTAAKRVIGMESGVLIALMPGSRMSEIHANGATFLATAQRLKQLIPQARFIVPCAGTNAYQRLNQLIQEALVVPAREVASALNPTDIRLINATEFSSHQVIAAADAVLVASGTATLEVALFKKPMVIAYKMMAASWWILQRMRLQPWVGLPNILAQDFLVPEFLQHEATPQKLAQALLQQLESPAANYLERLDEIHASLHRPTTQLVSTALERLLTTKK